MSRSLRVFCVSLATFAASAVGCAGCPDGSDAPSYRTAPRTTTPGQPNPHHDYE